MIIMRTFSEILLWNLPDKEASEREDFVRVRQADSIGDNLVTDYPLWLSGLVNVWLLSTPYPDGDLIMFCVGMIGLFFMSLFLSALISRMIRDHVHQKIGFVTFNSYDGRNGRPMPTRYIQQRWPGGRMNLDWIKKRNEEIGGIVCDWTWHKDSPVYLKAKKMHVEHSDYWRRQKNAWMDLPIKTNFIGMFVTIILGFILISYT